MSFDVAADAYGRYMGRFSEPLAGAFLDAVAATAGRNALDVGCGPGALTAALVDRLGIENVAAVDPSAPFVEAVRERFPSIDVRLGSAEDLPFADESFDLVLAQLVVHFMSDPVRGISEMARTAAPGGLVGLTVWDFGGARGPVDAFWSAVRSLDPTVADESHLPGVRQGHLRELAAEAGLSSISESEITVGVEHASFEQWWEPFTLGVGPAGAYAASLDASALERLRERCRDRLPDAPFATTAVAWVAWART